MHHALHYWTPLSSGYQKLIRGHALARGTWWRLGWDGDFQPEGRGFDSRSSRHVGTLGKSFTCSCLCASAWNSDTVSLLSRERLWVVDELKGRYRNARNEWMIISYYDSWYMFGGVHGLSDVTEIEPQHTISSAMHNLPPQITLSQMGWRRLLAIGTADHTVTFWEAENGRWMSVTIRKLSWPLTQSNQQPETSQRVEPTPGQHQVHGTSLGMCFNKVQNTPQQKSKPEIGVSVNVQMQ